MAGTRVIQAIGPSYTLSDRKSAVQRAVNLFLTQIEGVGEDRPLILRSAPGMVQFEDMGDTIRGMYNADGRWFIVAGETLYEIVGSAPVVRGAVGGSTFVSMRHGTNQLVVVTGANGYVLNLTTNVFGTILSEGWRGSNDVDHIDGYFVFVAPGTEQFYISAIDDASSLDALDFSSADTQPDNIVVQRVFKRELYLFGTRSTEVWINSGSPDFPLSRYNSTPIQVGIVGRRAQCIAADTLVFVGQTDRGHGYVYQMRGYQPVKVSTQAVEEDLNAAGVDLGQCSLWTYHVEGNEFVGIEAPGLETTWVWDASTQQWHERAKWAAGAWQALDISAVTFYSGAHYAAKGSKVFTLDQSAATIDGENMVRERTWPHLISPSMEPTLFRGLELLCTTGYGGNVTLEISNDGGYRWGAPLIRSLGVTGRFAERIRWLGLGAANDRVFRVRCSDAVPFSIYAATLDAA
ncbi:MAG TPA: packaged DNA stabilization protein [Rhodanobacteraceae bacterium]|nr:packaged DNA stabilization protein [Rhodanobacteraceae bacterium]